MNTEKSILQFYSSNNWLESELKLLKSDSNGKVIELIKDFQEKAFEYETRTEIDIAYGVVCGYIECCNALKNISDEVCEKLHDINRNLYMAATHE